jgi:hypothetical protein
VPSGGRPAKPRDRLVRWGGLHKLSPPQWPSTPHVDMCPQSRPAFGPFGPRVWPTRSMYQIHPCGDDDFDNW